MIKPNFFANLDALENLLRIEFEQLDEYVDFTLDIIELPFWFVFHTDKKNQTLKAYSQMELYSKDEENAMEVGSLVLDRESDEAKVKVAQDLGENMGLFLVICRNLSCLILEKNLERLYDDLDPNEAGIMLMEKDGELIWKVVTGKERPDLTIRTLLGGTTKGRPYMEDFWERSVLDDLSIEEKCEAAEDGNVTVMEELATLYLNGDDEQNVEPDPEKGVYWFMKLADTGNAAAMFNLGVLHAKGYGVKRDFGEAICWLEKAAEAGDKDAPEKIKEYKKLADAIKKAELGDAQAQADLASGLMKLGKFFERKGSENDYAESVKWAELSAAQGNADAMWTLALAYQHGRGVEKKVDTAIEYYKKGADLGNAACQHSLACYYVRGDYLKQDNKKAFELCQKSAAQGYGLAMKDLGRCYQFGTGCMGNMKTALEWYIKASEVLEDPELDQRIRAFQELANIVPHWDEDYPGEDG